MSSTHNFYNFIATKPEIAYEPDTKKQFEKLGKKFLKDLGKLLNEEALAVKHKSDWNKSGIASSGDHSYKALFREGKGVAVYISEPLGGGTTWLMFRDIRDLQDNTGGQNHWLPNDKLKQPREAFEHICNTLNLGTRN